MMPEVDVKALFPTPLMRISGLIPKEQVAECVALVLESETQINAKSDLLRHTAIADLGASPVLKGVGDRVRPYLVEFGELLFGERLQWSIKEIWTNVLEQGGYQAVHTHSNSFVSGIVYLTECHPSSRTVFHRGIGGQQYIFSNENPNAKMGPFNAGKWVSPPPSPGDVVLFPSFMLHEVPRNEGARRMTIALNAIPDRLETWGYRVEFSSHSTTGQTE